MKKIQLRAGAFSICSLFFSNSRNKKIGGRSHIKFEFSLIGKATTLYFDFVCYLGGPGSRKGRVVDDLCNAYGMHFICGEGVIREEVVRRTKNVMNLATIKEVRECVEVC